ncbi:type I-C CRISPR-associated protein Cas8c/Csd1 [Paenibacillus sp. GCM10027626]|uniref:type I-C CRISPR-associated protein Cas8c/Csd1 n=1 Tax=Paenibacillus sp. GCM10027626 TaxID=3273411 RepID=UPI003636F794
MSWLLNLYATYESNLDRVGEIVKNHHNQEYTLLPVSHTTQNAHIEVTITEDGQFHSAEVLSKSDTSTLIPCTEDSASRAGSKIAPYPLHDKLSYVAGDFVKFGGKVKKEEPFAAYIKQLESWSSSPYAVPKVNSIYRYLSKGRLIEDLVNEQVLALDGAGKLIEKWDDNKKYNELHSGKPAIFSVVAGEQESAFVRFNVRSEHDLTKVWHDPQMYDSFIRFYSEQLGAQEVCYVTGKLLPSTDKHANKIRHAADKAKLISANDTSGFTFRGRFKTAGETASISYEVSQKAHNALKWLINRQGKMIDQRVFLIWSNEELNTPDANEDLYAIAPEAAIVKERKSFTNQELAGEVAKALDGYKNRLSIAEDPSLVHILILDSATTGRMAVLYYRSMNKELYFARLVKWHSTCTWLHRYRKNDDGEFIQFYGAPATKDIAFAAYGPRAGDKVVKGLMERMLSCIIDDAEQKIPLDIVMSAYHRASNPVSMDKWEWEKTLSITCALINKREGYAVALDNDNNNRDYLFGRLLAVADVLERRALSDETRASNAIRYMNSFAKHPARTWQIIQASLQPYQAKLGTKGTYYSKIIDEIGARMPIDQFTNKPLSGLYLLGFYSQRHELYQKKEVLDVKSEEVN